MWSCFPELPYRRSFVAGSLKINGRQAVREGVTGLVSQRSNVERIRGMRQ